MKAAQISAYGHADEIQIVEVPKPSAGDGQVLVEVHAASINPFDKAVREGYVQTQLPITLGGDIAGVVVETGAGVSHVVPGDKVYGQAAVVAGNSGAFAEFAVTKGEQISKAPANIELAEAASLPLVGVSALQALTEHIALQSEQKVFIHGGGGGIGTIAIQVAKHIGAYVATTATGEGIEYVKQLGANEVIDYKSQDFSAVLHDFDAVFDTVGGEDFVKSYGILKEGGIAVSMIAPVDEVAAKEHGITAIRQSTKVTTAPLDKLRELVESGAVAAHVDKTFPLNSTAQAFEAWESGNIKGKVVIAIK